MIYRMPKFEYLAPNTLEETLSLISRYRAAARVMAGGTDLLVRLKERKAVPDYLIGLGNVTDLDYIRQDDEGSLRIGALTTHQSIIDSDLIKGGYELLATACRKIGTPQIRNMGTIGGNLCNAGPSADSVPSLLVLEAKLKLASVRGWREVSLDGFFTGPFQTVLEEDELLTEIIIPPLLPWTGGSYQYLTKITAVDETLVGVAALVVMDGKEGVVKDVRIALCSVAPTPIRARQAEEVLRGKEVSDGVIEKIAIAVANETRPRSRADYRKRMSAVLAKRALKEAIARVTSYGG